MRTLRSFHTSLKAFDAHSAPSAQAIKTSKGPPRGGALGFLIDIDGVLSGNELLSGVKSAKKNVGLGAQALRFLNGHNKFNRPYPYCLVTNGGGDVTDAQRGRDLSRAYNIEPIVGLNNIFQSPTPLLEQVKHLTDKRAFVVGKKHRFARKLMEEVGFQEVETSTMWVNNVPTVWPFRGPTKMKASQRYKPHTFTYGCVAVLSDSLDWGADIQCVIDILASKSGCPLDPKDPSDPAQWTREKQVPLFFAAADLEWQNAFPLPRLGLGSFKLALESVFRAKTGRELYSTTYGKPSKVTFDHAVKKLENDARQRYLPKPEKIYMIGDNPQSDIAGANAAGLQSILVKTGIYRKGEPAHKPTVIKENVLEALEWAVQQA